WNYLVIQSFFLLDWSLFFGQKNKIRKRSLFDRFMAVSLSRKYNRRMNHNVVRENENFQSR
ncbi:MAG: hypothetical protein AAF519_16825, partial [Bacteroidota bacterium]